MLVLGTSAISRDSAPMRPRGELARAGEGAELVFESDAPGLAAQPGPLVEDGGGARRKRTGARRVEIYRGAVGRPRKLCRTIEVHDGCVRPPLILRRRVDNLHVARRSGSHKSHERFLLSPRAAALAEWRSSRISARRSSQPTIRCCWRRSRAGRERGRGSVGRCGRGLARVRCDSGALVLGLSSQGRSSSRAGSTRSTRSARACSIRFRCCAGTPTSDILIELARRGVSTIPTRVLHPDEDVELGGDTRERAMGRGSGEARRVRIVGWHVAHRARACGARRRDVRRAASQRAR